MSDLCFAVSIKGGFSMSTNREGMGQKSAMIAVLLLITTIASSLNDIGSDLSDYQGR